MLSSPHFLVLAIIITLLVAVSMPGGFLQKIKDAGQAQLAKLEDQMNPHESSSSYYQQQQQQPYSQPQQGYYDQQQQQGPFNHQQHMAANHQAPFNSGGLMSSGNSGNKMNIGESIFANWAG